MDEKSKFQTMRSKILNVSIKTRFGTLLLPNVLFVLIVHLISFITLFYLPYVKWQTIIFVVASYFITGLGVAAGVHRLWSHRSYKVRLPLKLLLVFLNTVAIQRDIRWWARDHRVHHKYVDTDADAYNAKRGFFFSHIGWLMVKKHPDVIAKGRKIDISDLDSDPIIMFQYRYYDRLAILFGVFLPTWIPVYFWDENACYSFGMVFLRLVLAWHGTFCINSLSHMIGSRPYDKSITPTQNLFVSFCAWGDGYHNFHHTFPTDYSQSELGLKLNFSKYFILFMSTLGLAYDLKTVSPELVEKRSLRTGE